MPSTINTSGPETLTADQQREIDRIDTLMPDYLELRARLIEEGAPSSTAVSAGPPKYGLSEEIMALSRRFREMCAAGTGSGSKGTKTDADGAKSSSASIPATQSGSQAAIS
jgi:hypothetical protein